jgi:hypothetical protein
MVAFFLLAIIFGALTAAGIGPHFDIGLAAGMYGHYSVHDAHINWILAAAAIASALSCVADVRAANPHGTNLWACFWTPIAFSLILCDLAILAQVRDAFLLTTICILIYSATVIEQLILIIEAPVDETRYVAVPTTASDGGMDHSLADVSADGAALLSSTGQATTTTTTKTTVVYVPAHVFAWVEMYCITAWVFVLVMLWCTSVWVHRNESVPTYLIPLLVLATAFLTIIKTVHIVLFVNRKQLGAWTFWRKNTVLVNQFALLCFLAFLPM